MNKTGLTPLGVVALITLGCLLIAALPGCAIRSYQEGDAKYTSVGFLTNSAVAPFEMTAGQKDTPSYRHLKSEGVKTASDATVETAVTAAVKAATGK